MSAFDLSCLPNTAPSTYGCLCDERTDQHATRDMWIVPVGAPVAWGLRLRTAKEVEKWAKSPIRAHSEISLQEYACPNFDLPKYNPPAVEGSSQEAHHLDQDHRSHTRRWVKRHPPGWVRSVEFAQSAPRR